MVWHQAPGVGFGNGRNIQPVLPQKVTEILRLPENIFKTIGMVENMIAGIGLKGLHLIYP